MGIACHALLIYSLVRHYTHLAAASTCACLQDNCTDFLCLISQHKVKVIVTFPRSEVMFNSPLVNYSDEDDGKLLRANLWDVCLRGDKCPK